MSQHAFTLDHRIAPRHDAIDEVPQLPAHAPAWLRAVARHRAGWPRLVSEAIAKLVADGRGLSPEALLAAPAEFDRAAQIVVAALDARTQSLDADRFARMVAIAAERARARIRCARLGEAEIVIRLHLVLGDLERVVSSIARVLDGNALAA